MRLPDDHRLAGGLLPMLGKGAIDGLVQLAGGIVRNVEQSNVFRSAPAQWKRQEQAQGHGADGLKEFFRSRWNEVSLYAWIL